MLNRAVSKSLGGPKKIFSISNWAESFLSLGMAASKQQLLSVVQSPGCSDGVPAK